MSAIQVGGQLQPGTVDTPLDARVRIESIDKVSEIALPFVGMTFYAKTEAKLYVVTSLKNKTLDHTVVDNAEIDKYVEVGASADSAAKPATITLPVPYDRNNDNVTLVIDFDEDGTFTESKYTRVTMSEHYEKMKVFSNDKYIACEGDSVGVPFYGQSVSFTLDKELFPKYEAGKTYFARYCWVDSQGGRTEWKGFCFTGDVANMEPIRLPEVISFSLYNKQKESSDKEETPFSLDYLNGQVQTYTNNKQNLEIDVANVRNIPFGEALILLITNNGDSYSFKIKRADTTGTSYSDKITYMVVFLNLGKLYVTVNQTV